MKTNNSELIETLITRYPDLQFHAGASYHWSPKGSIVYYMEHDENPSGIWALLHETSHGLLQHRKYRSDFELVLMESAAWEHAKEIADELGIEINDTFDEHAQNCLDSYRDWQYKRSVCPQCNLGGLQTDSKTYSCLFCNNTWSVSAARFCRPYRRTL